MTKAELRKQIQVQLQALPVAKFISDGELITKNHIIPWLFEEGVDKTWRVATFKSMKGEINIAPLSKWLMRLQVPQFLPILQDESSLLWQPLEDGVTAHDASTSISVIFVPGLAFDKQGNRLGRGGGYYDRVLSILMKKVPSPLIVGLAMDVQIVDKIPTEPNDIPVDFLCTPTLGIFRTTGKE